MQQLNYTTSYQTKLLIYQKDGVKMKSKILLLFIAAGFLLTGCGSEPVYVETYSYAKQELSRTSEQTGQIVSGDDAVAVRSELTELPVAEMLCRPGSVVQKDDVLFRLDGFALQEQLNKLEADTDAEQKQFNLKYEHAEAALKEAKASGDRQIQSLYQKELDLEEAVNQLRAQYQAAADACNQAQTESSVTYEALCALQPDDPEYEAAKGAYEAAAAQYQTYYNEADALSVQIAQAEAEWHSAEQETESLRNEISNNIAELEYELKTMHSDSDDENEKERKKLREQLAALEVTAPCSGTVSECFASVGEVCESKTLASIVPNDRMIVKLYVPDQVILSLKPGKTAVFHTDASEQEYESTVESVSSVRSGQGFEVSLRPDHQDDLLIGMQAYVTLLLEEKNAYSVPNEAVFYGDDGMVYVYTAEKQADGSEVAVKHMIRTGIVNDKYTEIVSDELQDGADIILNPETVTEGTAVRCQQTND